MSVALAGAGAETSDWHDADIVLFGSSIGPLPSLAALARDSATRIGHARWLAVVPNLACVAGAFTFGLTGLAVVVISNLGTSMVYNRARRALRLVPVADAWVSEGDWCVEDAVLADSGAMPEGIIVQT